MNDQDKYEALIERLRPMVADDQRVKAEGMATHTEQVLTWCFGMRNLVGQRDGLRHLFAVIEEMIGGMESMEALELYSVRFDCQTEGHFTGRYTECEEWIAAEAVAVLIDDVKYVIDNATDDEVSAWRQARDTENKEEKDEQ